MDDGLSDIERHTYKIKCKSSGSCLSVGTSVEDKNSAFMEMDAQDEHANYRLWYFEKAGEFYKIKSKSSENCLSSAYETDKDRVFMVMDTQAQDEQEHNRLWYFEKTREFYKIKNKFSGAFLSSVTTNGSPFLAVDTQDDHANYRLWYFEKAGELDNVKNNSSAKCLDSCESEKDNYRKSVQGEQAKHKMSYVGGCGPCAPLTNTYATGQRGDNAETEIDRYTLFSSSFLSGAVYSLVPEIVRDALESRGCPRASAIAILVQGGMIVYNSPSYFAPLAGMTVRIGCSQLGFSPQASSTAGITVVIVGSLVQTLVFSQETVLDSVVDVAIGVAGSYAGSTLALKAKSWVYEQLWGRNYPMIVCEKTCQTHSEKLASNV
jgi:hypothetical protein